MPYSNNSLGDFYLIEVKPDSELLFAHKFDKFSCKAPDNFYAGATSMYFVSREWLEEFDAGMRPNLSEMTKDLAKIFVDDFLNGNLGMQVLMLEDPTTYFTSIEKYKEIMDRWGHDTEFTEVMHDAFVTAKADLRRISFPSHKQENMFKVLDRFTRKMAGNTPIWIDLPNFHTVELMADLFNLNIGIVSCPCDKCDSDDGTSWTIVKFTSEGLSPMSGDVFKYISSSTKEYYDEFILPKLKDPATLESNSTLDWLAEQYRILDELKKKKPNEIVVVKDGRYYNTIKKNIGYMDQVCYGVCYKIALVATGCKI